MLTPLYNWLREIHFPFEGGNGDRLHRASDPERGTYCVWFYSEDYRHSWTIKEDTSVLELMDALRGAEVDK